MAYYESFAQRKRSADGSRRVARPSPRMDGYNGVTQAILALQRTLGNATTARLLQRQFDPTRPDYLRYLQSRGMADTSESRARYLELRDQGHSLRMHGPDVGEQALRGRLSKGMVSVTGDPKTVRASARFVSYDAYMTSRERAVTRIKQALDATREFLSHEIAAWENSGGNVQVGNGIRDKIATMQAAEDNFHLLPVRWNGHRREPVLYCTYVVRLAHPGQPIGTGWKGKHGSEKTRTEPGAGGAPVNFEVYPESAHVPVPDIQYTTTAFNIGSNLALMSDIYVDSWTIGQHYPTVLTGERLEATDYTQPYRDYEEQ